MMIKEKGNTFVCCAYNYLLSGKLHFSCDRIFYIHFIIFYLFFYHFQNILLLDIVPYIVVMKLFVNNGISKRKGKNARIPHTVFF